MCNNRVLVLPSVGNYKDHHGPHDEEKQKKCTILFKKKVVQQLASFAKHVHEYILKVFELGSFDDYVVQQAHALICGGDVVAWKWHTDSDPVNGVHIDLSIICSMNSCGPTSMMVAGAEEEYTYQTGKFIVFDSKLFHRSGASVGGTMKLVLFLAKKR